MTRRLCFRAVLAGLGVVSRSLLYWSVSLNYSGCVISRIGVASLLLAIVTNPVFTAPTHFYAYDAYTSGAEPYREVPRRFFAI